MEESDHIFHSVLRLVSQSHMEEGCVLAPHMLTLAFRTRMIRMKQETQGLTSLNKFLNTFIFTADNNGNYHMNEIARRSSR